MKKSESDGENEGNESGGDGEDGEVTTDTVDITFLLRHGGEAETYHVENYGTYTYSKGTNIVWTVTFDITNKDWRPPLPNATTVKYEGGTVTVSRSPETNDLQQEKYVYTLAFKAEQTGAVDWMLNMYFKGNGTRTSTIFPEGVPVTSTTAYGLRSVSDDTIIPADATLVDTFTLPDNGSWTKEIYGLDATGTDGSGNAVTYKYYVQETNVATGYTVTYAYGDGTSDGMAADGSVTITNTKNEPIPSTTSITVKKEWVGQVKSSVTVKLLREYKTENGETWVPDGEYSGPTYELHEDNGWTYTFTDLELTGNKQIDNVETVVSYRYKVEETPVPEGYDVIYSVSDDGKTTTITNFQIKYGTLNVDKIWVNDTPQSEVKFKLHKYAIPKSEPGKEAEYREVTFKMIETKNDDSNRGTVETVKKLLPTGINITWKPTWIFMGDWKPETTNVTVSSTAGGSVSYDGYTKNGYLNTYSFKFGRITQNGEVNWDVSDYFQNQLEPAKNSDGTASDGTVYNVYFWTHTFEYEGEKEVQYSDELYSPGNLVNDLILEDANYIYDYRVEEVSGQGESVSYSYATQDTSSGIATIYNYTPTKVKLTLKKLWYDENDVPLATPPNKVEVTLYRKGSDGSQDISYGTRYITGEGAEWTLELEQLDENCSYYIVETDILAGDGITSQKVFFEEPQYSTDGVSWQSAGESVSVPLNNKDAPQTIQIKNKRKPTYVLPETGGEGTQWYTGVGAVLIGIALTLLYKGNKRKRRAEE